jgi:hypothetical protein
VLCPAAAGAVIRGDDDICGSLFSYMDLNKRLRSDHPPRMIREIANARVGGAVWLVRGRLLANRPRLDSAAAADADVAVAGVLFDPLRSGSWSSGSITICCSAGLSG